MENKKIIKKLFSKNYRKVLDVGGERGSYYFLKENIQDANIFCINIDSKTLPKEKSKVILADAQFLPFKEKTFDLIFAREVLEHLINPDKFLSEIKRTLKYRGEIILTTPNLNAWQNRILILFGFAPTNYTPYPTRTYGVPGFFKTKPLYDHPRLFPYRALKEIFNSNGFKLEKILGVNMAERGRWLRNLRKLIDMILPVSWKEDIVLKAVKCR